MRTADPSTARIQRRLALLVVAALAGVAAGQNSWFFDVQYSDPAGVINSPDDTATVNLWAAWDAKYYAFDRAKLDVVADDLLESGVWLDSHIVLPGPGSSDGTIEGERVSGIIPSQLQLPGQHFADTSNPILAWRGTWSASVLHPREVPVYSESQEFKLYIDFDGTFKSFLDTLTEGYGVIRVVPTPASAVPLLLPAVAMACRRRR